MGCRRTSGARPTRRPSIGERGPGLPLCALPLLFCGLSRLHSKRMWPGGVCSVSLLPVWCPWYHARHRRPIRPSPSDQSADSRRPSPMRHVVVFRGCPTPPRRPSSTPGGRPCICAQHRCLLVPALPRQDAWPHKGSGRRPRTRHGPQSAALPRIVRAQPRSSAGKAVLRARLLTDACGRHSVAAQTLRCTGIGWPSRITCHSASGILM